MDPYAASSSSSPSMFPTMDDPVAWVLEPRPPPNQFICFRTLYYAKVAELDRLMARMNPEYQKRRQPEHSKIAGRIWGQPEFDQTPWRDMYAELLVKYRANKGAYEQAVLEGRPTMSLAVQEAARKASGRRQQARRRTNTAAAPEAGMGWEEAEEGRPAKRRRTGGQYGPSASTSASSSRASSAFGTRFTLGAPPTSGLARMAAPYYNFDVSTDRPTSYTPTLHQWGAAPPAPFPGPSFNLIHPTPSQMAQQHLPYVDPYRSAPAHLPASYSQDNHYFPNVENVPAPPPAVPAPSFNFHYPMPSQMAQHRPHIDPLCSAPAYAPAPYSYDTRYVAQSNLENVPLEQLVAHQSSELWQPSFPVLGAQAAIANTQQQGAFGVEASNCNDSSTFNVQQPAVVFGGHDLSVLGELLEGKGQGDDSIDFGFPPLEDQGAVHDSGSGFASGYTQYPMYDVQPGLEDPQHGGYQYPF